MQQEQDAYCPQGWPERNPSHRKPVCQLGRWASGPGWERPLWVSGGHLKYHLKQTEEREWERDKRRRQHTQTQKAQLGWLGGVSGRAMLKD